MVATWCLAATWSDTKRFERRWVLGKGIGNRRVPHDHRSNSSTGGHGNRDWDASRQGARCQLRGVVDTAIQAIPVNADFDGMVVACARVPRGFDLEALRALEPEMVGAEHA